MSQAVARFLRRVSGATRAGTVPRNLGPVWSGLGHGAPGAFCGGRLEVTEGEEQFLCEPMGLGQNRD